jgi:hypothetical protein
MEPKDFDINNFLFFAGDTVEPIDVSMRNIDCASSSTSVPDLSFRCTIQASVGNVFEFQKWMKKIRRSMMRKFRRRIIIAIFMAKRGI